MKTLQLFGSYFICPIFILAVRVHGDEAEQFSCAAHDSSGFLPPFCKMTRHLQLKYLYF